MIYKTKAIILQKTLYQEYSILLLCMTQNYGLITFCYRNILKYKYSKFLEPLSEFIIHFTIYSKNPHFKYVKKMDFLNHPFFYKNNSYEIYKLLLKNILIYKTFKVMSKEISIIVYNLIIKFNKQASQINITKAKSLNQVLFIKLIWLFDREYLISNIPNELDLIMANNIYLEFNLPSNLKFSTILNHYFKSNDFID